MLCQQNHFCHFSWTVVFLTAFPVQTRCAWIKVPLLAGRVIFCYQSFSKRGIYSHQITLNLFYTWTNMVPTYYWNAPGSLYPIIEIIYIITYTINGRLEADINGTVGFFLCDTPTFPPQLVLVTRIPFCQPGVEGLEKENFYRTQELDNINIDNIIYTTRSKWWIRPNEQRGKDSPKTHREERHPGRLIRWIRPICPIQGQRDKRRTIRKSNSPPGDRMWRSHCRHQREPRRPQTAK